MNKIIPITLLTGYLGSGKTTLVNHVLNNQKGYKVAVIVNDIGEVNIDATLIQKGGVVNQTDDSLVPLQNGCICCTLKVDLMKQIAELAKTGKFDYILIEASGICEPIPIAQTITAISSDAASYGLPEICRLDNVVCVVDSLRLATEFGCGSYLENDVEEEDIENLIIQQIEFCNVIVLNKVDEIKPEELAQVKVVIRKLQPEAEIIETNYGKIDVAEVLDTRKFDLQRVSSSAGWIQELENEENQVEDFDDDDDDEDEHEHEHHHDEDEEEHHHHHHHHDHEHGETEEYGVGTFVYYRRAPFERLKFEKFADNFPNETVIRCKGLLWFSNEPSIGYVFEQAGKQVQAFESGEWIASAPKQEQELLLKENPDIAKDWDKTYGDRMIKLVFIGRNMDKEAITEALDKCLDK
jgi:G3E family GTPase